MGRNLLSWVGLGAAALLAAQSAQGGERKLAAPRHSEMSARPVMVAAIRPSRGMDQANSMRALHGRAELAGSPVRPLETRLSHQSTTDVADQGRHEHKSLTFFRLNPKFGDVSVQPVVGGVNGAQVSVGF